MKRAKRIGRRAILAGAGGVAVSLPLLDIMRPSASASGGTPCRFLVAAQGIAQARPNGPTSANFAALADLRAEVTFVTGMSIEADRTPQPGGRPPGPFHPTIINPLVSGVRSTDTRKGLRDTTADQIVADAWAGTTRFHSLAYRTQKEAYIGGEGAMSVTTGGAKVTPIASPRIAWQQLFGGSPSAPPTSPGTPSTTDQLLRQDRSVLDLVSRRARRLLGIASLQDRERLERHFEEIRALERRIQADLDAGAMPPPTTPPPGGATMGCGAFPDPGADPTDGAYGWSGETARGEIIADLIAMAFACDLSRSVSWLLSYWQSKMSAQPIAGLDLDVHEVTHSDLRSAPAALAEITNWHVAQFARLVRRLRDTPEGGGTLLDRTVLVMLFEGEGAHAYSNNTSLIAGRPDVLRAGETIASGGAHPAQLLSTAMHSVGVPSDLGEVPGQIGALFR